MRIRLLLTGLLVCCCMPVLAFRFIGPTLGTPFDGIPFLSGMAVDWNAPQPTLHLFDNTVYKGHANYVVKALKRRITFTQFKENVKEPFGRRYVPFILLDLRGYKSPVGKPPVQWAVLIEDYQYTDTPEQLAELCRRLMLLTADTLARRGFDPTAGKLLLYVGAQQRPNGLVKPFLQTVPFQVANYNLAELTLHPRYVQVLSKATVTARVRRIPADSTELIRPAANELVIYEQLPLRAPLVAGYITLAPQTPLSHLNLLARNRGTLNIALDSLCRIPGLDVPNGTWVTLTTSTKRLAAVAATPAQIAAAIQQTVTTLPSLPVVDRSASGLRALVPGGAGQEVNTIGTKAANYALLLKAVPEYVKPAWALPFSHYFEVLRTCGAEPLIEQLAATPPAKLPALLAAIRDSIASAEVDTTVLLALQGLCRDRLHHPLRLRSSTNCEDLPQFNGAGLYTSVRIRPGDKLREIRRALLVVYASLWSDAAYDERAWFHIDHRKAGMAVLVHEAFDNEQANGVVLAETIGRDYQISINAQPGDHLVTNPEPGDFPEIWLLRSAHEPLLLDSCTAGSVFADSSAASAELLAELTVVTNRIHLLLVNAASTSMGNYAADIEFKVVIENGRRRLYVKQARLLRAY